MLRLKTANYKGILRFAARFDCILFYGVNTYLLFNISNLVFYMRPRSAKLR